MTDVVNPVKGLALASLDFSGLMTDVCEACRTVKKVARVGVQALFMKGHYYHCQPLDPESEKLELSNEAAEKIGFTGTAVHTLKDNLSPVRTAVFSPSDAPSWMYA